MSRKVKTAVLLAISLLLVTVPGVAGCGGGGGGGGNEIVIGILTDFTGAAASAIKPTMNAMMDYFKMMEEEDPLPDVKVKFITYDTRLDYSRVIPGYISLVGKGAIMMNIINPQDRNILVDTGRLADDEIPVVGSQETTTYPGEDWVFNYYPPVEAEVEAILQWVMATWEEDRPCKIGHLGWGLETTIFHQNGIDNMMAAYPGEFEFIGLETAPMGTSSWTQEISNLEEADYILFSVVGSMMASFVQEARYRGYEGGFLSGINAFPGYWDLATASVDADELYGCYYAGPWPWWSEDVEFITGLRSYIEANRADDADVLTRSSGPITGWGMGMVMYDAVKRAVDSVGADKVDGDALREALAATNISVAGFGNDWTFTEGEHFLCREMRAFEWNIDTADWEAAPGGWITPLSLSS